MDKNRTKKRINHIRWKLKQKHLDALLIVTGSNVTYTTGFGGEDSWVLITQRQSYLLTDGRYTEQASQECPDVKIIERKGSMAQTVGKVLKRLKSVKTIGLERNATIAQQQQLKKNIKTKLRSISGITESVRTRKDEYEIKAIVQAGKLASQALNGCIEQLKPGTTENEFAGLINYYIRKNGGTNSFETIVAFGANASQPHHIPDETKLKKKDTVLIDFGARFGGYCSDITRCFRLGGMSAEYKKVYQAVLEAQQKAIDTIKPGVRAKEVDSAARRVIKAHNLPLFSHGTGHGLGLDVHEQPILAPRRDKKLEPGMVVTIEPGVYIPGRLGIRIEDDVLVTQYGARVLTEDLPKHI